MGSPEVKPEIPVVLSSGVVDVSVFEGSVADVASIVVEISDDSVESTVVAVGSPEVKPEIPVVLSSGAGDVSVFETSGVSLSILHSYCVLIKTHMGKSLFSPELKSYSIPPKWAGHLAI